MTTSERLTSDEIEHLVMMATCAPSVHNTQPWRFTETAGGLTVHRDRSRQLGVIDPDGRELLISCGAALHHLQVAARALGVDASIVLHVTGDTVADVQLTRGAPATGAEVESAVAILHRHTHRGRFNAEPVSGHDLDALRIAAEVEGGLLRIVKQDELVEVEVLLSRAQRSLAGLSGYPEELARWVWHGLPDEDRGDGLPQDAIDHDLDRAESLESRAYDGPRPRPSEPPVVEHPAVVLLSSPADSAEAWVQSGRALSALLLAATELGLLAQPLGQVIDLPPSRHALAKLLGTVGAPQMLLRLGHGTIAPVTPRRAVADVLTTASAS